MKKLGFPAVPTFNIEKDKKEQAKKVLEEASEFVEAVKAFTEYPTDERLDHVLEEAADVNQALMNALTALNMEEADLEEAALYCFARNHARGRFKKPKPISTAATSVKDELDAVRYAVNTVAPDIRSY